MEWFIITALWVTGIPVMAMALPKLMELERLVWRGFDTLLGELAVYFLWPLFIWLVILRAQLLRLLATWEKYRDKTN